jgi:hypothetical protein
MPSSSTTASAKIYSQITPRQAYARLLTERDNRQVERYSWENV